MTNMAPKAEQVDLFIAQTIPFLRLSVQSWPNRAVQIEERFDVNGHWYAMVLRIEPTRHQRFKVTAVFRCETPGIDRVSFIEEPAFRRVLGGKLKLAMMRTKQGDGLVAWRLDPNDVVGEDEIGCCVFMDTV